METGSRKKRTRITRDSTLEIYHLTTEVDFYRARFEGKDVISYQLKVITTLDNNSIPPTAFVTVYRNNQRDSRQRSITPPDLIPSHHRMVTNEINDYLKFLVENDK
ncbi:MAG: hypothetical protein KKE50_03680 [Nanoarchaeota archaeon]|nr:hypothetical protein [Nanoarchaeota archaeon]